MLRYLAKRSFAVDVASKKVATTPVGGSCVNDNSDFRKRSIDKSIFFEYLVENRVKSIYGNCNFRYIYSSRIRSERPYVYDL